MAAGAKIPPLQTASATPGLPSHTPVVLGQMPDVSYTGGPPAPDAVASYVPSEDTVIPGALQINPAFAGDFYAGRFLVQRASHGYKLKARPKDRVNGPNEDNAPFAMDNAWKKNLPPREAIQFGPGVKP